MRPTLDQTRIHPAASAKIQRYQADLIADVERLLANHSVVVLGMAMNPFPGRARRLLRAHAIPFEYFGIGSYLSGWRTRLALKLWSGWPTFPMIFVKGTLIGGYNDLARLLKSGELSTLLAQ